MNPSNANVPVARWNQWLELLFSDRDLKDVLERIEEGNQTENPIIVFDREIAQLERVMQQHREAEEFNPLVDRGVPRAVNGLFPPFYSERWLRKQHAILCEARLEFLRPQRPFWVLAAVCWATSIPGSPDRAARLNSVHQAVAAWDLAGEDIEETIQYAGTNYAEIDPALAAIIPSQHGW